MTGGPAIQRSEYRSPPCASFWADQAAARGIGQRGKQEQFVCASGITPSGTVHIGNFREAITVAFVAQALRDAGVNASNVAMFEKITESLGP